MSYRFRLSSIVQLREQSRDERRRELAQAYEAERILRAQIAELQVEIDATRNRTRLASGQGSVNVEDLLNSRRYELITKSQVKVIENKIVQVLTELERRRAALVEADREVKVLEKLRERGQAEYDQAAAKRDDKQLDEAALRGYFRQREVTP